MSVAATIPGSRTSTDRRFYERFCTTDRAFSAVTLDCSVRNAPATALGSLSVSMT